VAAPRSLDELQIERVTTASRVAEALREELLSGTFPPGTPMRDVHLAKRAGVSRPTMREALAELVRDGLLVHSLHRGVEVMRVEADDVRDIYATRRLLESAGLRALMRTRSPELGGLEAAIVKMEQAAADRDLRLGVDADTEFHLAIVGALGIRRLADAACAAMLELRLVLSVIDRSDEGARSRGNEHTPLLELIRAGQRSEAARALALHLDEAEARVLDLVETYSPA
jgi:DNA-binding GntR family transcriptional regulator